jgi:hypothetical protein
MQPISARNFRCLKPAIAGLMVVFVLLLGLFASSSVLHFAVHGNSSAGHEQCVICSIAKGQVETGGSGQPQVAAPEEAAPAHTPITVLAPDNFDYSVALSRGPPPSVVSL